MSKVMDDIERTPDYIQFINNLKEFHASKGTTLQAEPILGGKKLDLYKIFQAVIDAGGFDQVTKSRCWKHVGDAFNFPSTCTNSAYILKGVYIRNLLGWEEEMVWGKHWDPPEELRGPNAHKASTLAGKSFKKKPAAGTRSKSTTTTTTKAPPHYTPIRPDPNPRETFSMVSVGQSLPTLRSSFSFEELAIRNEPSQCTIAETHHQSHPSTHIHIMEEDRMECLRANKLDSNIKQRVLLAMQSSNPMDVDWALNCIVTISFECPEQLQLDNTPLLLDLLLKRGDPFLLGQQDRPSIIKILHILRNFSFLEVNARILASDTRLRSMIQRSLALGASNDIDLGRHCIDVLENIASFIELSGPFDELIPCLANLLNSQERPLLIGALHVLTSLAMVESNQVYLLSGAMTTVARATQLLVINDEELVGYVIEYLYQYSRISADFKRQLMTIHSGADIGILVSLLSVKSKFFIPKVIRDREDGSSQSSASPRSASGSPLGVAEPHGVVPCMPNLSAYQELDEPYRCLGWLKDKFEVSAQSSVLSLDDMYLLYEMRFGQEGALKMKDFYTVLKIAFPEASAADNSQSGMILEGTLVRGIQIKMTILQDGAELMCQWTNCSQSFEDELHLQRHVIQEHVGAHEADINGFECMWTNCANTVHEFKDKDEMAMHLGTHFDDGQQIAVPASNTMSNELLAIARRQPKMAPHIQSMFSHFSIASSSS
ncbi:hypothetical protein RO3G_07482 [Lichtheimia corymbifera JMRC:FSU:9682]|uniref:ARID domain-containing protein n=1 Tax=Lichtheimia corymbifera JMRC:FSU:9682 TaxID=1263082 RepID=A0A068S3M5_9FUNG|nr:hypothetical protein RO3G_07482 [Lichtheimia corymbifera JMRC:FSU:9682]